MNKFLGRIVFCFIFFGGVQGFGQDAKVYEIKADSLYEEGEYKLAGNKYYSAFLEYFKAEKLERALDCLVKASNSLFDSGDYIELVGKSNFGISKFLKLEEDFDQFVLAKVFLFQGLALRYLEKYQNSLTSYECAIDIYKKLNIVHSNVAFAYKNAASIYMRRLNYEKAINYFLLSIENDTSNTYLALNCKDLASCYFYLDNFSEALFYFEKGVNSNPTGSNLALLNSIGAITHFELGNIEIAEKLTLKTLYYNKNYSEDGESLFKDYILLSKIYFKKNRIEKGFEMVKQAEIASQDYFQNKNREVSKHKVQIGTIMFEHRKIPQALQHYQSAIIQVFPNFNSEDINDNPPISDVYPESWIMTACARKAQALKYRYDQKGDVADLKNAAHCYDLSFAAIQKLKQTYGSDAAKIYLGDYSHEYFEEAIEVSQLLYEATNDETWLKKVFEIMEQSKASALTDAIQKHKAIIFSELPDSLLKREEDLRFSIADAEKGLQAAELSKETEDLAEDRMHLSDLRREYEQLVRDLKNQNPKFRALTESTELPDLATVRERLLQSADCIVEYFEGSKAIYFLQIEKEDLKLWKIEKSLELETQLDNYLKAFVDPNIIANDYVSFLENANSLANRIFPGSKQLFENKLKSVLIIPDGILNYLPFDALVFNKDPKLEYFIQKANIYYGYSATVLLSQLDYPASQGQFFQFAPAFAQNERGLTPLKYSEEETIGLSGIKVKSSGAASLLALKEVAPLGKVLHLSTHARGGADQVLPQIALWDEDLYLPEIYALNLSADLVVLSACQTNLGQIEKGEGVMSLARGFTYAGAKSLVASLWEVNERSTAKLFSNFYQHQMNGQTKATALHSAKLDYLNNAEFDAQKSPYYWAGFIYIGNDGKLDLKNSWAGKWIGWSALLLVFLWWFWKKRK